MQPLRDKDATDKFPSTDGRWRPRVSVLGTRWLRRKITASVWDILSLSLARQSPERWRTVSAGSPVRLGKRTRRRAATLLFASEVKAERHYEKSKGGETVGTVNDSEIPEG
jgi:hypothetical protein